jgi:single-strand DNA-binding protein
MARSVNKVILIGNLGKDAETKFTSGGTPVTKFTLATQRRWKDQATGDWKDETEWHNITLWKQENVAQYLQKGKQVYVEGRLRTSSYEDKEGQKRSYTEVVCEELMLLSSGGGSRGGDDSGGSYERPPAGGGPVSMPRSAQRSQPAAAPAFDPGISDDDVPF